MNELIPAHSNEDGNLLVSGRDLHEFLEIGTQYTKWFDRMVEYGFIENVDYIEVSQKRLTSHGREHDMVDHHIKIEMAKEISMIQRNDKGKKARQYFLDLERKWNSPEMVVKRAHDYLVQKVAVLETKALMLEQRVAEYEPKITYLDRILQSKGTVTITQIAKDYGMSGQALNKILHEERVQYRQNGQWLLYREHHDKGYTKSETIDIRRKNGDQDVTMNTRWTQKGRLFIYEILKRRNIVPVMDREKEGVTA
ncbi:phage antirepressor Ant [Paenibacillus larvae subsp. pulvifaciens]|uniref:Phage antirepressor Ant n=1 Tax=Paenibacillus larvae subsp. pulvifaciens TaxID=1477 RepID=A0A1V0UUR4_9BACL|nr:phage antirepressor KilAC domain-containing protein [Paenibacillus larvae]ARF68924.1 phage antirepressor Ant [Paenibacillus larvae subsp. pulvifaciens]